MATVGIRDLKAHLSSHLRRVQAGSRLVVTERGMPIATIVPVDSPDASPGLAWARTLVAGGRGEWSGGKPSGTAYGVTLTGGASMSDTVLHDRR